MKYITFAVPCYNSENYMRRCVDSLLIGGKDVEIILIDDGSSDRTAQIADEYEIEYPDIVRVVDNLFSYRLRFRTLSGFTYLPGKIGTSLTIGGYRLAKKVYRFQ